ncbi:MAG: hypothetical protein ACK5KT_02025 [Dysgonomonas sp.]
MRLTTKIVLGIIAAFFLINIIIIVCLSINYERPITDKELRQEDIKMASIDIPPYKVITLDMESNDNIYFTGTLNIHPLIDENEKKKWPFPDAGEKNKLLITEKLKPNIRQVLAGDTLKLYLKPSDDMMERKRDSRMYHTDSKIDLFLFTNSDINFKNNIFFISVNVNDITANSVNISTGGKVQLQNCNIDTVNPIVRDNNESFFFVRNLNIDNSRIDILNCKFMEDNELNINNSKIGTGNFSGYTNQAIVIPSNTFKKINLVKQPDERAVNIEILSDTVQFIFP